MREENRLIMGVFLGLRFRHVPALEAVEIREHHGLEPALVDDEEQHRVEEHVYLRYLGCNV